MSDPVFGKIRFSSFCQPPLAPATYKLEVRQTVTTLQPAPFACPDFEFSVAGPRFALNPADIYSVYPPESSTGNFASTLPHVVFTRRTIPWERTITSTSPVERPWMALLLLSTEGGQEGTVIPKIEPRKVRDLMKPPDGVAGPKISCEPHELDDPCNTIDLDAELFRQVAPSADDLSYLAHVREVTTDHKETVSFLTDGSFSVVVGNRFPKAPQGGKTVENTAVLVSLEGMQDFLPESRTQDPAKKLRLVVLASWTFRCEEARDFIKSMEDLGDPLQALQLPLTCHYVTDGPKGEVLRCSKRNKHDGEHVPSEEVKLSNPSWRVYEPEPVQYVRAAFIRGYTALNHNTRRGEKTFSWYRGPLTPLKLEAAARYDFKAVPDALVRYDHQNGLMDLTYAAAAQLGRLLGLQDRSFAQVLSEWRTEVQAQIKARLRKEALRRNLRSQPAGERVVPSSESEFLQSALTEAMKLGQTEPADTKPHPDSFKASLEAQDRKQLAEQLPATVRDWLARRVLLYGVPFLYLVPDERMLPMPSMRFFRIDPQWIKRLLDGACSVGRNSTEEESLDSHLGDKFFDIAVTGSAMVRRRDGEESASKRPSPTFPFEGFLLRSPIVRGWQGLEMEAWYWKDGKEVAAPALRIDRLAPDIMLCIFNGPLARIEIRQPPEGMHFGADGFQKTSMRKVTANGTGKQIDLKDYPEWYKPEPPSAGAVPYALRIPFRGPENLRVVDVSELAKRLHKALTKSGGMDKNAPFASFASAEFGVQMTKSPGEVRIKVSDKP